MFVFVGDEKFIRHETNRVKQKGLDDGQLDFLPCKGLFDDISVPFFYYVEIRRQRVRVVFILKMLVTNLTRTYG